MTIDQNIAILGAGGWGTALAIWLSKIQKRSVLLWGHNPEHVATLKRTRFNTIYLPGTLEPLPDLVEPTANLQDLRSASLILFVTPSKALRQVALRLKATCNPSEKTVLMCCTKGIEHQENAKGKRMSEILTEIFPQCPIAVLSGPSHAEEMVRNTPTAVVIGAQSEKTSQALQQLFTAGHLRSYTSTDLAGIEWGGALKNVFALAAGISDGLKLGDNAKAALVTRALTEMIRLGTQLGGRRETFQGLSGIGDLMVTCFSQHSRNRRVGELLGQGQPLDAVIQSMQMVAEGVTTTRSAYLCARDHKVPTPIIDQVYAVLYQNRLPLDGLKELLLRTPRPEEEA